MAMVLGEDRLNWLAASRTREEVDVPALVAAHAGLLYRVTFSVVRRQAEAEDIVQETFLRAWEQRGKLAAMDEPRAWLLRVAWNLALDRKRRITPEQMEESAAALVVATDLPADRQMAATEELRRVLEATDRLPKLERAVLLLSAVEELSVAEIAVVVGKSESGVRSLVYRARTHLEERLRASKPRAAAAAGQERKTS